ncbi:unnamed protein product, partial [Ectocarpus sp. 12 AP-2014]
TNNITPTPDSKKTQQQRVHFIRKDNHKKRTRTHHTSDNATPARSHFRVRGHERVVTREPTPSPPLEAQNNFPLACIVASIDTALHAFDDTTLFLHTDMRTIPRTDATNLKSTFSFFVDRTGIREEERIPSRIGPR